MHSDGTGTFKYSVNLSSSKTKISSILALDSIDGKKVPKIPELEQKILEFKTTLSKQPGIKNVVIEYNFQDYLFKLSCDFDNVKNLQTAIETTLSKITEKNISSNQSDWLVWSDNRLERNVPSVVLDRFENSTWIDTQLLEVGTYTSISRFDSEIEAFTNKISKISKSKTALMIQVKTNEVFNNTEILKNKITVGAK